MPNDPIYFSATIRSECGAISQYRFIDVDINSARRNVANNEEIKDFTVIRVHCLGTSKPNQLGLVMSNRRSLRAAA